MQELSAITYINVILSCRNLNEGGLIQHWKANEMDKVNGLEGNQIGGHLFWAVDFRSDLDLASIYFQSMDKFDLEYNKLGEASF